MLVYLCNLTHTEHGLTNELPPYALGCLKSYLLTQVDVEVELFMEADLLQEAFRRRRPDLLGLSNYMWNATLSARVAEIVHHEHPDLPIVCGGPNVPLDDVEGWLRDRPWCAAYLLGEAEASFASLVCQLLDGRRVSEATAPGLCTLRDGVLATPLKRLADGSPVVPRADLDRVPSPYLLGFLDPWLEDPRFMPVLSATRGCPFTCTFCVSGLKCYSQVRRHPTARVLAEAEYIAQRYQGKTLYMTDDNFGMFPEDKFVAAGLARLRRERGWPEWIVVSAGKGHKDRLLRVADILSPAFRLGASVQSTDPGVLQAIRRTNISTAEMAELGQALRGHAAGSYSEVILGLPRETRQTHLKSILDLVDWGCEQIRMHQLTLFDGMVLSTQAERQKYSLQTRWRVVQRSYGAYTFLDQPVLAPEVEEVVVSTDTLTFDDYFDCRRFALTIALLHNDGAFRELRVLLESVGLSWSAFLRQGHEGLAAGEGVVSTHVREFERRATEELYPSRTALLAAVTADSGVRLHGEEIGANLLYNTAGHLWYHHGADVVGSVFDQAVAFLRAAHATVPHFPVLCLSELREYSLQTRGHLANLDGEKETALMYDFTGREFLRHDGPRLYRFAFTPRQRDLFRNQLALYGTTDAGLGKIIARSPMRQTYREATPC